MNTPITDAVNMERYADHYEGYCAMLNNARRLELDRAALMEALANLERRAAFGTVTEEYLNESRRALATARANFPES